MAGPIPSFTGFLKGGKGIRRSSDLIDQRESFERRAVGERQEETLASGPILVGAGSLSTAFWSFTPFLARRLAEAEVEYARAGVELTGAAGTVLESRLYRFEEASRGADRRRLVAIPRTRVQFAASSSGQKTTRLSGAVRISKTANLFLGFATDSLGTFGLVSQGGLGGVRTWRLTKTSAAAALPSEVAFDSLVTSTPNVPRVVYLSAHAQEWS